MMSRGLVAVVLAAVSFMAGCDALLTDPAPAAPELTISFAVQAAEAEGDGVARAFDRIDRVHLRFVRPDSASRDTIVRMTSRNGVARARLVLDTRERVSALGVLATLAAGAAPLFEGSKVIRVEVGVPTSAEVPLTVVAARIRADRNTLALSVGDTVRLASAVTFATGDTIPGLAGSWKAENPAVVFVTQAGLAVGRTTGQTRLMVQYRDLADTVSVRVTRR